jgi:hypothetical protein
MATLVNLSGFQYGVENDETSLNIEAFNVTVAPQEKVMLEDKVGNNRGFAIKQLRSEITLNGELSAASAGVLAFTFSTACTIANDIDYFGQTTGTIFLDSATINQSRSGWKSLSQNLSRDSSIVLA